ncbi:MAG: carboxyvinyl-carboxyphosphonate phosphorylmutase [Parvibaculum sp.]|jgi:2-methylisocitrate lyase-like PEP mutase family enzyme|uniref:isocitrate lyase/PEP mutase family protein n=1 Tax=Parvibaculum sp. TaxID=2024848 RepID=UPI000C4C6CAB|nr:isocitrate lyase/phosphoenolpyruvate mutase family protein [Parvibaculum sp.]MAU61670.1 carboxyvinyl-carboxyphosphonate phosphorylmutase [Parvibaculum sp.]|tara:strand:+ start:2231 stop:3100 length:870 start_codon:yes stop_codon:yes gene_type:complete
MTRLQELLKGQEIIVAPGAYDALSAKLAAKAGAKVVYMTGFGVSGASFGLPDIGLVSAAEMSERVRAIAASCAPVPLIADGDNGHGGPLNAAKLVRAYEAAGADCIQIEDQVFPKRCGHMEGKEVVAITEAAAKIRAAAEARESASFKIMARTDARATHDLDEALRRGEAFLKAGADILFIEAPRDEAELRKVAETFKGVPLVANIVEDGKTPYLGAKALEELGFKIVLFPVSALLAVTARLQSVYETLVKGEGLAEGEARVTFQRYNELIGLGEMLADAAAINEKTET